MEKIFSTTFKLRDYIAKEFRILTAVSILTMMIYVRDLGFFTFSPAYFIAYITGVCLFLNYTELCCFFFFFMIAGCGVHGITYIPLLAALIIKSKRRNRCQYIFTIIILLIEAFHILTFAFSFPVEINKFVVYALTISIFFFVMFDDNLNNDVIKKEMRFYILGTVAALLLIIRHTTIGIGTSEVLLGEDRIGKGFEVNEGEMATVMNSNQLALYSIVGISMLLYNKDIFNNIGIKIIVLIVLFLSGILSSSRTWLFVMAFVVFIYILFGNMKRKFVLILVVAVVGVFALQYQVYSDAFSGRFASRLSDDDMRTGNGRTEIFASYNKYMYEHPEKWLLGTGNIYYIEVAQKRMSIHNGTQQIYVFYGLAGIIIFISCWVSFHKRFYRRNKPGFWYCVPFVAYLLFIQSTQFINPATMMLPLTATLLPLKIKK